MHGKVYSPYLLAVVPLWSYELELRCHFRTKFLPPQLQRTSSCTTISAVSFTVMLAQQGS